MSTWIDRVRSHPLWQNLAILGPAIDQAFTREGIDAATFDGLHRLKTVLAFIGQRLEGADPNLIQLGPMDNINVQVQAATTSVQTFISDGNPAHITNANQNGDSALGNLALLNVPYVTTDFVALREAVESYRAAIERNIDSLNNTFTQTRTEIEGLRTRLTELTNEVTNEKQRLSVLTSEHQSQFSQAQEVRNQAHATDQAARQEKFLAMMTDYSAKLSDRTAADGKQRETLLKQHEADLNRLSQEYRDSADRILKHIETREKEVENLVGVIGSLGVTSGYQKTAKQAKWIARLWQAIALAAIYDMSRIAFKEFLPLLKEGFTWEGFAARLVVFIPLSFLAWYAITQADRQQQIERRNQKLALELEAIGPFLASLPKEKQEEFKYKMGERSFGTSVDMIDDKAIHSPSSTWDMVEKSKELPELVTKIVNDVLNKLKK